MKPIRPDQNKTIIPNANPNICIAEPEPEMGGKNQYKWSSLCFIPIIGWEIVGNCESVPIPMRKINPARPHAIFDISKESWSIWSIIDHEKWSGFGKDHLIRGLIIELEAIDDAIIDCIYNVAYSLMDKADFIADDEGYYPIPLRLISKKLLTKRLDMYEMSFIRQCLLRNGIDVIVDTDKFWCSLDLTDEVVA